MKEVLASRAKRPDGRVGGSAFVVHKTEIPHGRRKHRWQCPKNIHNHSQVSINKTLKMPELSDAIGQSRIRFRVHNNLDATI